MYIRNLKKELLTIPNLLSMIRLLLLPVYATIYLHAKNTVHFLSAGVLMILSCLTDMLDGKIARKYNMVSNIGKLLDPIADKATQFTLIVCFCAKYSIMQPVLLLFLVKEFFQLIACILALRNGKALPGALIAGKVCTTVLFVSLIFMVIFDSIPESAVIAIALIDSCFLIISFVSYIFAYYGKNKKLEDFQAQ